MNFLLGRPIFRCYISFREGINHHDALISHRKIFWFWFFVVGILQSPRSIYLHGFFSGIYCQFGWFCATAFYQNLNNPFNKAGYFFRGFTWHWERGNAWLRNWRSTAVLLLQLLGSGPTFFRDGHGKKQFLKDRFQKKKSWRYRECTWKFQRLLPIFHQPETTRKPTKSSCRKKMEQDMFCR